MPKRRVSDQPKIGLAVETDPPRHDADRGDRGEPQDRRDGERCHRAPLQRVDGLQPDGVQHADETGLGAPARADRRESETVETVDAGPLEPRHREQRVDEGDEHHDPDEQGGEQPEARAEQAEQCREDRRTHDAEGGEVGSRAGDATG